MTIAIIAAVAANGVIGRGNTLPWHLPSDLKRFKRLTMGHTLVMGRRTFESIGRPLPGRTTIVISRQQDPVHPDVVMVQSLDEALDRASGDEVFIAGGAQIYALALPRVTRLYITRVDAQVEGDTFFPPLVESEWRVVSEEPGPAGEEYPHRFQVLERSENRGSVRSSPTVDTL